MPMIANGKAVVVRLKRSAVTKVLKAGFRV